MSTSHYHQIGWLIGADHVLCYRCANSIDPDIWAEAKSQKPMAQLSNVDTGPYGQNCHMCGHCIQCPQNGQVLWPKEECSICPGPVPTRKGA